MDQLEAESTATVQSYSAAMNACIRGRCPERAVQAFQRALKADCPVDRIMINTLLRYRYDTPREYYIFLDG